MCDQQSSMLRHVPSDPGVLRHVSSDPSMLRHVPLDPNVLRRVPSAAKHAAALVTSSPGHALEPLSQPAAQVMRKNLPQNQPYKLPLTANLGIAWTRPGRTLSSTSPGMCHIALPILHFPHCSKAVALKFCKCEELSSACEVSRPGPKACLCLHTTQYSVNVFLVNGCCVCVCDGVSPLIPHLNDRQVRKGKEGTGAGNSFLNRTVPVRDAGNEPTTSGPAAYEAAGKEEGGWRGKRRLGGVEGCVVCDVRHVVCALSACVGRVKVAAGYKGEGHWQSGGGFWLERGGASTVWEVADVRRKEGNVSAHFVTRVQHPQCAAPTVWEVADVRRKEGNGEVYASRLVMMRVEVHMRWWPAKWRG
eukprot:365738-Chlamydomonas_euryale.AAC.19